VISPDQSLDDGFLPLNFDQAAIETMVAQGVTDGEAAISSNCGATTNAQM
jgi:hypothetical protein